MVLNKVEICGVNTAKLPLLSDGEKEVLFEKIKAGDEEAKEQYIKGNLRLVLSVIKRFSGSSENPDDLFQIGCIGLIKAINNFNPELEVKFSTYAVFSREMATISNPSPIMTSRSVFSFSPMKCTAELFSFAFFIAARRASFLKKSPSWISFVILVSS